MSTSSAKTACSQPKMVSPSLHIRAAPGTRITTSEGDSSMSKVAETQSSNGDEPIPDSEWNPTVGSLIPEGRTLVSVLPDDELWRANVLMTANNYSQLAVMSGPGESEVKGAISWKSISPSYISGISCEKVRDFTTECEIVSADSPIFDTVQVIADHDFVLVKDEHDKIAGIVTASDLAVAFRDLFEPLHLSGGAELGIRQIFLNANFEDIDLQDILSKRRSKGNTPVEIGDLTLGQFSQLLEDDEYWKKLNVTGTDRSSFRRCLGKLKDIRNPVMHFRVRKLNDENLGFLRRFSSFIKGQYGAQVQ